MIDIFLKMTSLSDDENADFISDDDETNMALEAAKLAGRTALATGKAAVKVAPVAAKAAATIAPALVKGVVKVGKEIAFGDSTTAQVSRAAIGKGVQTAAKATFNVLDTAIHDDGIAGTAAREIIVKPLLKEGGKQIAKAAVASLIPGGSLAVSAADAASGMVNAKLRGADLGTVAKEETAKSVASLLLPFIGGAAFGPPGFAIAALTAYSMRHGGVTRPLEKEEKAQLMENAKNKVKRGLFGWFSSSKDEDDKKEKKGGKRVNSRRKKTKTNKRKQNLYYSGLF